MKTINLDEPDDERDLSEFECFVCVVAMAGVTVAGWIAIPITETVQSFKAVFLP